MDIVAQKRCTKCGQWKDRNQFPPNKKAKDGLGSWCRECVNTASKAWATKNKERCRQNLRNRRRSDPEKSRSECRRWKHSNPDRSHELAKKYREKEGLEAQRKRLNNWRSANPDKVLASYRKRRAIIKGSGGKISAEEWQSLKEKYNFTCLCCGRKEPEIKLTLDHVIPLTMRGPNIIENAQPLCRSCNCRKGARHIDYRIPKVEVTIV